MFARDKSRLDQFLHKLQESLKKWSDPIKALFSSPELIPDWASSYTHLLYSVKSIPPILPEEDKLYISYETATPASVNLIGKTSTKPINRTINVERKGSSVILTSKHRDIKNQTHFVYKGEGRNFEMALNDYFYKSDLKQPDYAYTINGNVHQDGDAFLLPTTITDKGEGYLIAQIVDAVRKIIQLVPENKHDEVLLAIEKDLVNFDDFLNARNNKKIINHYDPRLWLIVESLCKYIDPIEDHVERKTLREHIIAESCSNLMRGADIKANLEKYFSAMKMHNEIIQEGSPITHDYTARKLFPELAVHRDEISKAHNKLFTAKSDATPRIKP